MPHIAFRLILLSDLFCNVFVGLTLQQVDRDRIHKVHTTMV